MKTNQLRVFGLGALLSLFLVSCAQTDTKKEEAKEEKTEVKAPVRIAAPAPSPASTINQTVGLTKFTLEYSRPGMKGRKIFGDLVPFDKIWRTGANANTKITFDTDIMIGETTVKAGSYSIYTKPGKSEWTVMLYATTDNWGNPREWDDAKVVASATVKSENMPMTVESFTITFDDLTNNSAVLGMLWENTYVGLPFTVPTDGAVMASIEEVMKGEPNDRAYYDAAVYFKSAGKDINQALTWIDKAVEMTKEEPKFWYLRQQSLIHAKAGKTETAIAAAKQSLELAKKAGNADYVKMNTDSLKEWGAM
ncbi:MAG: dihydrolipoamide dehydrogenase [Flavobacteriaceae bacterium]|nr:dihydrolipoamide dehydrogenase [Flavobacteriaceae bacterium]|tara:strand:- start:30959 stop:31882 length:924 start_codon:yes stop_codon:yes gene_type:complete